MTEDRQEMANKKTVRFSKLAIKYLFMAVIFVLMISAGYLVACSSNSGDSSVSEDSAQETVDLEGKQVVEIIARGGYSPESVDVEALVPTVLLIKSQNAFGCERAFRLPQFKFGTTLPVNGETYIELGTFEAGTKIVGTCSMGMYSFIINFN
jgi:hypothetical protein